MAFYFYSFIYHFFSSKSFLLFLKREREKYTNRPIKYPFKYTIKYLTRIIRSRVWEHLHTFPFNPFFPFLFFEIFKWFKMRANIQDEREWRGNKNRFLPSLEIGESDGRSVVLSVSISRLLLEIPAWPILHPSNSTLPWIYLFFSFFFLASDVSYRINHQGSDFNKTLLCPGRALALFFCLL